MVFSHSMLQVGGQYPLFSCLRVPPFQESSSLQSYHRLWLWLTSKWDDIFPMVPACPHTGPDGAMDVRVRSTYAVSGCSYTFENVSRFDASYRTFVVSILF